MKNFLKKLLVFTVAFVATCGMVTVDRACSQMSSRQEVIGMEMQRSEGKDLVLSYFGQETNIDGGQIEQQWKDMQDNWEMIKSKASQL